jgi:transposase-like protein
LRDQESHHELPALPIIVDYRAAGANGSWLPAFPVPGVRAAVQRATALNRVQVPTDIMFLVVFWRLRYKLSLRDLAEMFLIRGIVFTHEVVRDWEAKLAPLLAEGLRKRRAGNGAGTSTRPTSKSPVSGALYRAIDRDGNLVDVYLSETRDMAAAKAFLRSARSVTQVEPEQVTTDSHTSYPKAIADELGTDVDHRTSQYKNNVIEQDHRGVKGRSVVAQDQTENPARLFNACEFRLTAAPDHGQPVAGRDHVRADRDPGQIAVHLGGAHAGIRCSVGHQEVAENLPVNCGVR